MLAHLKRRPQPVVAHWQMYSKVVWELKPLSFTFQNPVQPWLSDRLDVIEYNELKYMASLHNCSAVRMKAENISNNFFPRWAALEKILISDVLLQSIRKLANASPLLSYCHRSVLRSPYKTHAASSISFSQLVDEVKHFKGYCWVCISSHFCWKSSWIFCLFRALHFRGTVTTLWFWDECKS